MCLQLLTIDAPRIHWLMNISQCILGALEVIDVVLRNSIEYGVAVIRLMQTEHDAPVFGVSWSMTRRTCSRALTG